MDVKRIRWLKDLNNIRKKRSNDQNGFKQTFHRSTKRVHENDKVLLEVYLVECYWRDGKIKDGISSALQSLSHNPKNQDLRCLVGLMFYEEKQFTKAYKYLRELKWRASSAKSSSKNKTQIFTCFGDFRSAYWENGTIATTMRASLDLLVASLYYRARIEYDFLSDTKAACDSWRECWDLITLNAKACALLMMTTNANANGNGNGKGNDGIASGLAPEYFLDSNYSSRTSLRGSSGTKAISPYSVIAFDCIVLICQVSLQTGYVLD